MNPDDTLYVDRVVNDPRTCSLYVRAIDHLLAGMPVPPPQTVSLAGDGDGLVGLDDNDFIGSDAGKTGLHALDQVQELTLLLVPGRTTPAVHNAMVCYAELDRDGAVFAVLVDPPANQSATTNLSRRRLVGAKTPWKRVRCMICRDAGAFNALLSAPAAADHRSRGSRQFSAG